MTAAVPAADAYGGVLIDPSGRVLLREPTGHFGGYAWTYAKGRPDPGESPSDAALREGRERTSGSRRTQTTRSAHRGRAGGEGRRRERRLDRDGHGPTRRARLRPVSARRRSSVSSRAKGCRR